MSWCENCRSEVSDVAGLCPRCGCDTLPTANVVEEDPLAQLASSVAAPGTINYRRPTRSRVQVIEQTSKFWKAQMLISVLILLAGFAVLFVGGKSEDRPVMLLGGFAIVVGFVWYSFARIGAWWNHG